MRLRIQRNEKALRQCSLRRSNSDVSVVIDVITRIVEEEKLACNSEPEETLIDSILIKAQELLRGCGDVHLSREFYAAMSIQIEFCRSRPRRHYL